MSDLLSLIVYGLASLVGIYTVIFVGPVVARLTYEWCQDNLGPKRENNVIDLNERRRRQLDDIVNPQRRAQ